MIRKNATFPTHRRSQDGSQQSDPVLKRFHATKTRSGHARAVIAARQISHQARSTDLRFLI
jgi:hypothetical protein